MTALKTHSEVIVAIADNGADYNLLSSYAKSKLYINKAEIAGNRLDDDKNGRIDDIRGPYTGSAANGYLLDPFGTTSKSHGRSMTNNIVNQISNAEKILGQEVKTSVMHVPGSISAAIKAIESGARVVSMSLGFTSKDVDSFKVVLTYAQKHDALVIIRNISMDDLGEVNGKDHIIEMGFLSSKKPYGTKDSVDFLEQGRSINDASESHAISTLAGKIAAVWGINPNWTSQQVLSILKESTDLNHEVARAKGLTADMGGQINLEKAVALAIKANEVDQTNIIDVKAAEQVPTLNLKQLNFSSYDRQDLKAKAFDVTTDSVSITGNSWKKVQIDYKVTDKTVLSFDFKTTMIGEIHGIGIDTDNKISPSQLIQLAGTQNWASHKSTYTGAGDWQTFRIDLGKITKGNINFLTFVNDDDKSQKANSQFSNIRLYEDVNGSIDSSYSATADEDTFDFNFMPAKGEYFQITKFDKNVDNLDISDLLQGYDPVTDAINDFVQITTSGKDSILKINSDGVGNDFVHLATIVGVTGMTDEAALVRNDQLLM